MPAMKLTGAEIDTIRAYGTGLAEQKWLARKFGVSQVYIKRVQNGTIGGIRPVLPEPTPGLHSDGPCEGGGTCINCQEWHGFDIYFWRGRLLCGDCRFYIRHGQWPVYSRKG